MKSAQHKKTAQILDIFICSFNFIVIQYLLACGLISFKASPFFIILLATNAFTIELYWEKVDKTFSKKLWAYLFLALCMLLVTILLLLLGYFPISNYLKGALINV